MTRVLVVHHDIDLSDQEVDSLRRLGYDARQCTGPMHNSCPILSGEPCDMADDADVLVYDVFASGEPDGAKDLINRLREIHPTKPTVLTSSAFELDWVETAGPHAITPLVGQPTGARLHEAIQAALADSATRQVSVDKGSAAG